MNRTIGFGTNPPHFALVDAIGDDGFGDEPARCELRPFRLLRGVGLLRTDLDVLAAGDDVAAIRVGKQRVQRLMQQHGNVSVVTEIVLADFTKTRARRQPEIPVEVEETVLSPQLLLPLAA